MKRFIEKHKNKFLLIFAIFDLFLFVRWWRTILIPFSYGWDQSVFIGIITILNSLVVLSFAVSVYSLFLRRKWCFLFYYIQFLFRISFCYLSLGFLTICAFQNQNLYFVIMIIAMLAEFIRLFVTVIINKSIKNITGYKTVLCSVLD